MAGFENDVLVASNLNFDDAAGPPHLAIITAAGMLPIGTGNLAPIPEILGGSLTSTTLTIGYSSPNITINTMGGGVPIEQVTVDGGLVITPSGSPENITITGNTVANGTHAKSVFLTKNGGSSATVDVQVAAAIGATDITKSGMSAFNSAQFTVDANGFVGLKGSSVNPGILGVHPNATSGGGTDPTVADASGNISILGATVAPGTNPIRSVATAANSITMQAQISQAIASADATKIGLSNFDSARFTVDANGFVSINGAGIGETITGNSGGALSPTAGNWNILGRSGSKTSGSASTLTINSPPFSQVGGSGTSVLNSGEFVTAAVTRTLPATAGLLDGDLVIYSCTTAGALVVTANTGQTIRIGSLISSSAGTATSTAIGDSVSLRWDATGTSWRAVSVIGTWVMA